MITPAESAEPTIIIIDDDCAIGQAVGGLLDSVGLRSRAFASVQHFLADQRPRGPGCMVLDVRLPGRSGLDFYNEFIKSPGALPVIFISGHADVSMSVRAIKAGAVEFLTKPVRPQELLDAIQSAIVRDMDRRRAAAEIVRVCQDFDNLTVQERKVALLVVTGKLNKQIAAELGLSEATVKLHRGRVMKKMGALNLIDLVRIVDRLSTDDSRFERPASSARETDLVAGNHGTGTNARCRWEPSGHLERNTVPRRRGERRGTSSCQHGDLSSDVGIPRVSPKEIGP
jgi:FixJ family two-component response regulator